jgi:hypothetical protein
VTAAHPVVDRYLAELSALLPASTVPRQAVIAEIRDHLLCELEMRLAAGQSATAAANDAVARVGDARTVAASFVEVITRRAVARAEQLATVSVLASGVIVLFSSRIAIAPGTIIGAVAGVVGWFAAQVSAVALVVVWLRGQRLRAYRHAGAGIIGLSLRALAVAVGAAAVAVGFDLAAVIRADPWLQLRPAIGLGFAVVGTAAAAISLVRAARRAGQLRGLDSAETSGASALEDLRWTAHRIVEPVGIWRGRPAAVATLLLDRAVNWALRHRAGAAVVAGMGAGSGLALASLREHGLGGTPHQTLLSAAAAAVQFGLEGGAVVVSVYLFDRMLRLWPHRAGRVR